MSSDTTAVSARLRSLSESPTLAISARAKQLRADGEDVIGFGAGEPDFPTPAHVVAAAQQACADPAAHHYGPAAGLPELREAIARKTRRDSGLAADAREVTVANGGKHALHNVFQALLDPGDEVLLPAPYWVSYPEQIRLAGGVDAAHQGAGAQLAVQPHRRRLPARPGRGDRPVGCRAPRLGGV